MAAAVALTALTAGACRRGQPIPEGNIAATLTLPTTSSTEPFDPTALRGKPAIVVFAWPTCGYCAQEIPIAQKVADAEGATLVVVFTRGAEKHAASVSKSLGVTGPVLVDKGGALGKRYGVEAVPYTLVLDAEGSAVRAYKGAQDEDTLRSAVVAAR
ncbi:MAG: TlpA family protein disulfide reductase [Deltaproteobacteria bacterium]|nr:TlpA family protein disulfide reductase [Deltaproteobacteria bacterium]MCW5808902.1 TlpA family protein disulfide reductase [Deltaproteobacteria bacterium]